MPPLMVSYLLPQAAAGSHSGVTGCCTAVDVRRLGLVRRLCTWARLPSAEEQLEMPLLLVLVVLLS